MNFLKRITQSFGLQRAERIARIFIVLAAIVLLSSCGLFRAIASPPTETSAGALANPAVGTPPPPQDQSAPTVGPVDSLAVGSTNLLYWSPATGDLALAGDQDVRVMPLPQQGIQPQALDAAPVQPLPAEEPTILTGAQAAPRLAWADANNQVFSLDAAAGGPAAPVVQEDAPVTGLALAPDGNSLAVTTSDGSLAIVPQLAQPGAQTPQEFALPAWLTNLSYSPDGQWIGGTDKPNFLVYILDAKTGSTIRTLEWFDSPSANLYGAFFAPDWSRIAWVAQTAVQIMSVADGSKGPLLNHEDHVSAVAWSPDGTRLATVSVTHTNAGPVPVVLIWDPVAGTIVTELPQPSAVRSLAFSPDGNQIAVIDSQQNLQVWNLER